MAPGLESATRGLEEAQAGLSGILGNFQTRAANVIAPYEIEAGLLGENVRQTFELYKTTISNQLSQQIAILQEQGLNDRATLDRASKLAEAERAAAKGDFQDLGNKVVLINPATGQVIQEFLKGLSPTKGSSTSS